MKKWFIFVLFFLLPYLFGLIFGSNIVYAASCSEPPKDADSNTLQQIEESCLLELSKVQKEKESLSREIRLKEVQETTTRVKINQTQEKIRILEGEISVLSIKISRLDTSLNFISKIFLARIVASYKMGRTDPLILMLSSKNLGEFLTKYQYLKVVQAHDREMLLSMEETKVNYDEQKQTKEKIQQELASLKEVLERQKSLMVQQIADRKRLLGETEGKESVFQKILETTRAELEAIQGIIAGQGTEFEVGKVGEGERIASVIYGASPCSTGTHLHFQVKENGELKNPLSFLRSISLIDNSGGDPRSASGGWNWPLNEPIKFNQGYGANTSAIRSRLVWYNFHTGIDIASADLTIKAVKSGTLLRGGISCGKGTLRYVKVRHDEGNVETFYLHVNY